MLEDLNNLFEKEQNETIKLAKRIKYLQDNNIDYIVDSSVINIPVLEYYQAIQNYLISNSFKREDNTKLFLVLEIVLKIILYWGIGFLLSVFLGKVIVNNLITAVIISIFCTVMLILFHYLIKDLKKNMSKNTHKQNTNVLLEWLVSKNILKYVAGTGYVKVKVKQEKLYED